MKKIEFNKLNPFRKKVKKDKPPDDGVLLVEKNEEIEEIEAIDSEIEKIKAKEVKIIETSDEDQEISKLTVKELKKQQKEVAKAKKKKERERKKAEREHGKKVRKAAKEELKKDKDELYQMRKNTFHRILRVIFWSLLVFVFIRGMVVSFRPDPTIEINQTIEAFKTELNQYREQNNEVMAFAENFAYEYLTYDVNGEADYIDRLKSYANKEVYNLELDFNNASKVNYTQAYKKRDYSKNQVDVYVLVNAAYTTKVSTEDNTDIIDKVIEDTLILKVPIAINNGKYLVESTPMFVNDDVKLDKHEVINYQGQEISGSKKDEIDEALLNFFAAYYEGKQSVIDYFLIPDTDKSKFIGLDGRIKFVDIISSKYYSLNQTNNDILAIIKLKVRDINDVDMLQNMHLNLIYKDEQYYVKSMNTRISNLNFKKEETENE